MFKVLRSNQLDGILTVVDCLSCTSIATELFTVMRRPACDARHETTPFKEM